VNSISTGAPGASSAAGEPAAVERLPRSFGRYLLFDRIGRGGMADIYLARAKTELGGARLAVVKQILSSLSRDPGFSRMLIAEAKLAARLSHASIVQVFDLGREDDRLFIAMEYVEGFDLNQLLRELSRTRTAFPAEFALLVVGETLRALDYAHRARSEGDEPLGIVHRDVSPSNVLVSFEGEVKLCDFGIARALYAASSDSVDESVVRRAPVVGKSAYMAPEHARGEDVDARVDVFSAGILLWELCAGRRLYKGSEAEMLAMARLGEAPPLPDRGLPRQAQLQAILDRALRPSPETRYQTAREMLDDLEAYVAETRLLASPLKLGRFLTSHFADDIVCARRARERAAAALEQGPPAVVTPLAPPASSAMEVPEDEPGPSHGSGGGAARRSAVEVGAPEAAPGEGGAPSGQELAPTRSEAGLAGPQPAPPALAEATGPRRLGWLVAVVAGAITVTSVLVYFTLH
jgi:serine/threonine-protein kinase